MVLTIGATLALPVIPQDLQARPSQVNWGHHHDNLTGFCLLPATHDPVPVV
jgi:hypothetical protein